MNRSAPPPQIRIDERSASRAPASSSMRNIAGVPEKTVTPYRLMVSRIDAGSNRDMKNAGVPSASCSSIAAYPPACATGITSSDS